MADNPSTQLTYVQYFELANQYLDAYTSIAKKIQDPTVLQSEKKDLYVHSEPLLQQAYEFQKMGFAALTADLKTPVEKLEKSVKDAAATIKLIYEFGKIIEVIADLVAIGAVIAVPAIKPESIIVLPSLIKELSDDVRDLKQAA